MGFTLTPDERDELIKRTESNAERIFPYIGGEEVNTNPEQMFHRYVINFGAMSLEEAGRWPDLLDIIRRKVKPERDKKNREQYRKYWWHYGEKRPALYEAIDDLPRCLVTAKYTKHLCFSFQRPGIVFNSKLFILPLADFSSFAVLQSRPHSLWAWLLSSTLGEGLAYSTVDAYETFPFPDESPRTVLPPLETIGKKLYEARAAYMREADQGLTKTYNALKDPECTEPGIVELRRLHEQMDRAVLDAYGWGDIAVPPYEVDNEAFEDEVIDRLHGRNHEQGFVDAQRDHHAVRATEGGGGSSGGGRGPRRRRKRERVPTAGLFDELVPVGASARGAVAVAS